MKLGTISLRMIDRQLDHSVAKLNFTSCFFLKLGKSILSN